MAKVKDKLLKTDLYLILEVSETASDKEIVKGYRKKALKCHPDKNPDNPKAADQFHELSLALEILTDAAARAAYDLSRKAKKEVDARNKVLDSKRKKFKEDLEAREQAAEKNLYKVSEADAEKKLLLEVERLRTEGSRLLEQEQIRLRELLKASATEVGKDIGQRENTIPRLKLKWKATKGDSSNGGYNDKILSDIFSCYGKINTLLVSSKKNGSAIVEFESSTVSSEVLDELGLAKNPLSMVWLSGKPSENATKSSFNITNSSSVTNTFNTMGNEGSSVNFTTVGDSNIVGQSGVAFACGNSHEGQGYSSDFENLVLRKMRQAEERKRLIEQMKNEDDEEKG